MRILPFFVFLFALIPVAGAAELRIALVAGGELSRQAGESAKGSRQSSGLAAFNEELAREICRRLNARCATVNVLFGDILPGIEAGKFEFGFGNFLRTPEREKRVAFSDGIWRSSSRLVATPATVRRFENRLGEEPELDNLRQARIAVVAETQQHAYLKQIAGAQELDVLPVGTTAEIFALLREAKVDFCLLPMLSAYAMFNREPPGTFEFVGPPLTDARLGGTVHVALPKSDDPLRLSVNQAIVAMRVDGTYHRIMRRHFPFSLD